MSFLRMIKCKNLVLLFIMLPIFHSYSIGQQQIDAKINDQPIKVSVKLSIDKIYNINSVNETFQIEGHITYIWVNDSLKIDPDESFYKPKVYENEEAIQLLRKNETMIPAFEMINAQGNTDVLNTRIEIKSNRKITYEEGFSGTFITNMDFTQFPFDSQQYLISIEAFSHNSNQLVFKDALMFFDLEDEKEILKDWKIISTNARIKTVKYDVPDDLNLKNKSYSRVNFEIQAKRLSWNYLWNAFIPTLAITLLSFIIFWIRDFRKQMGLGLIFMFTLIAINFYSASTLPKLPYNTYIEYVILIGYAFILLGLITVIINRRINGNGEAEKKYQLLKYLRFPFLFAYFLSMAMLYFRIFQV